MEEVSDLLPDPPPASDLTAFILKTLSGRREPHPGSLRGARAEQGPGGHARRSPRRSPKAEGAFSPRPLRAPNRSHLTSLALLALGKRRFGFPPGGQPFLPAPRARGVWVRLERVPWRRPRRRGRAAAGPCQHKLRNAARACPAAAGPGPRLPPPRPQGRGRAYVRRGRGGGGTRAQRGGRGACREPAGRELRVGGAAPRLPGARPPRAFRARALRRGARGSRGSGFVESRSHTHLARVLKQFLLNSVLPARGADPGCAS